MAVDVVIVGGGIAGLATAYELHRRGVSFTVLERGPRPGGVILSEDVDGFTIDDDRGRRLEACQSPVWDTALKLKAEVGNSDPCSRQYAEALSIVLVHELIRFERTASAAVRPLRGGLPVWQQRRVVEFIEEHLGEPISLAALAELVDLSLFHFARAFTQSFGMPPHRYHMARRMDRARSLLQKPALSVTEIGIQIGFRETSSFTRAFGRFMGLTPTEYRRHRED